MTSGQCRAGRAWLGWSRAGLSVRSGVSLRTLTRFESDDGDLSGRARRDVEATFLDAGVSFPSVGEMRNRGEEGGGDDNG